MRSARQRSWVRESECGLAESNRRARSRVLPIPTGVWLASLKRAVTACEPGSTALRIAAPCRRDKPRTTAALPTRTGWNSKARACSTWPGCPGWERLSRIDRLAPTRRLTARVPHTGQFSGRFNPAWAANCQGVTFENPQPRNPVWISGAHQWLRLSVGADLGLRVGNKVRLRMSSFLSAGCATAGMPRSHGGSRWFDSSAAQWSVISGMPR